MLLIAVSVSAALPPAFLAIAFATVILPGWVFAPALPVVTVTLVPALSAARMLPVVTIALSLVVVKFGPAVTLVLAPAVWIVMLFGSRSHCPARPFAALASTEPLDCRVTLPLVSTKPPLPPDRPVELRSLVRPDDHPAALAVVSGIGAHDRIRSDIAAARVAHFRVPALVVAPDEHCAAARVPRRIDQRAVRECDLVTRDRHAATGFPGVRPRRIEPAPDRDDAARPAFEPDDAVPDAHRARLDNALVVDDGGKQRVLGTSRENDGAAVGLDQLPVRDQCSDRRLINREADQAVARERECDLITGTERNRAEPRGDRTFVRHLRRDECDVPALRRADRPPIDHGASTAGVAERVAAGEKIGVRQTERRGDDPAHVHLCAGTEEHAVRVQHEHLPVGGKAAQDGRWILAEDAIQCDRARVGLAKDHRFRSADTEALPVDGKARARLMDRERVTGVADDAAAGADLGTSGQGMPRKRRRGEADPKDRARGGTQPEGLRGLGAVTRMVAFHLSGWDTTDGTASTKGLRCEQSPCHWRCAKPMRQ